MSANTKIEWADHTFNPWMGCQKVSPACDHCYAEVNTAVRALGVQWGPGAERRRTSTYNWKLPQRWNAEAARQGIRYRVFCASLADVFDNAVDLQWREDLFKLIQQTPHLDWLLLTKRIGNVAAMISIIPGHLPPNVWLGATICNQEEADRDIPKLLQVPAAKRFLSMEPLLGPVDLRKITLRTGINPTALSRELGDYVQPLTGNFTDSPRIDWVIVGGESGHHARPMHPDWARSLRDQCQAAGVAFFFKQHGEWLPTAFCSDEQAMIPHRGLAYIGRDGMTHDGSNGVNFFGGDEETARIGKKAAGRLLDGRTWDEFPA